LLITIDSLRADHVHSYGYTRDTTPNLDRFAKEGIRFNKAYANAPYTTASVFSLLTSTYSLMRADRMPDVQRSTPIAEVLMKAGYHTIGVHSNPWFDIYNFNKGFSIFVDPLKESTKKEGISPFARSEEINAKVLSLLKSTNDSTNDEGLFVWVHYMDVHDPYHPKKFFFGVVLEESKILELQEKRVSNPPNLNADEHQKIIDSYDNCIKYLDDQIASLVFAISELWDPERTLVIITSDHGDAFYERGVYGHGGRNRPIHLYDYMLHVPLIIWSPSRNSFSKVREIYGNDANIPTGLVDISPLILDLMKIEKPRSFMGKNPFLTIYQTPAVLSQGFQATDPNDFHNLHEGVLITSLRTENFKVIQKCDHTELYDLQSDPFEMENIAEKRPDVYKKMKTMLDALITTLKKETRRQELIAAINRTKRKVLGISG
jgi:arylsulfatase A-like enzyme